MVSAIRSSLPVVRFSHQDTVTGAVVSRHSLRSLLNHRLLVVEEGEALAETVSKPPPGKLLG